MAAAVPENAPVKKDDEEKAEVSQVNGAMTYGIATITMGIVVIGCLLPILSDLENYENIRGPLQEAGSPLASDLVLPFLLIAVGVLMFVAGGLALVGVKKNSKVFVYIAMTISILSGLAGIAIGVHTTVTIEGLRKKLEGNPVTDPTFDDAQLSVMDFTAAIYNECCLNVYDSLAYNFPTAGANEVILDDGAPLDINQRAVGNCVEDDLEATCPIDVNPMFPEIVTSVLSNAGIDEANALLCHCIGNEERANQFVSIFQRDGMCDKYRNIVIEDVDSILVPVVNVQFQQLIRLLGTAQSEISAQLPMRRFALVGKILPPASTYGEAEEEIGWSCGLGYAKSVAFYLYLYIDSVTKPATIGAVAAGTICFISTFILLGMWFCCNLDKPFVADEDGYGDSAYVDEYSAKPKTKKAVPLAEVDEEYA